MKITAARMNDPGLFTSGALFTQDYLVEGITGTTQYRGIDVTKARAKLTAIFAGFPMPAARTKPRPKAT